jgi:16S rRNA processing protein RimM
MPSEPKSRLPSLPGQGLADDEVELGRVSGVFGTRGDVRLYLHNRDSVLLGGTLSVILVAPDGRRLATRVAARPGSGRRILAHVEGIDDPEHAATLANHILAVRAADLPDLEDDEFWVFEVVGAEVFEGERRVGTVSAVHSTAGGDVFAVDTPDGEILVPSSREFVADLDLDGHRLVLVPGAIEEG